MTDKELFLRIGYIPDFKRESRICYQSDIKDIKDKRVAILLSGGLDSSLVATWLKKAGRDVTAYTVCYRGYKGEEREAAEVAAVLRIPIKFIEVTIEGCLKIVGDYHRTTGLHSEWSGLPLALLMKAVKKDGFKKVFTGDGGDDLFGGYIYFKKLYDFEEGLPDRVKTPHDRAIRFYSMMRDVDKCSKLEKIIIPHIESYFKGKSLTQGLSDYTLGNWFNRGMVLKNRGAEIYSGVKIIAPIITKENYELANSLSDWQRIDKWIIRQLLKNTPLSFMADKPKLGFKPPFTDFFKKDFTESLFNYRHLVWNTSKFAE